MSDFPRRIRSTDRLGQFVRVPFSTTGLAVGPLVAEPGALRGYVPALQAISRWKILHILAAMLIRAVALSITRLDGLADGNALRRGAWGAVLTAQSITPTLPDPHMANWNQLCGKVKLAVVCLHSR